MSNTTIPGLKPISTSGVIYVMNRAMELGFSYAKPEWSNFGQGAPETGDIEGDIPRVTTIEATPLSMGYASIGGVQKLREGVAKLYNDLYRQGKESQYTAENVCITGGGRLGIARCLAALDNINFGHFIPDYASYQQLLSMFNTFSPVTIELDENNGYAIDPEDLRSEIQQKDLGGFLISNPCNPTARHIRGEELKQWVDICRDERCIGIFDEFYSHYVYGDAEGSSHGMVSAAAYVDDVNSDPIVMSEGLTKNWRYPGFRICWIVGPKDFIEAVSSVASAMDGGASHPVQNAAIPLVETETVIQKTAAIKKHFEQKAEYLVENLERIGIEVPRHPEGSFYCWGRLDALPESLRDSFDFFEAGLEEKVISVPGTFFDINPNNVRPDTKYSNCVRFSFGPKMEQVEQGVAALERVVAKHSSVGTVPSIEPAVAV